MRARACVRVRVRAGRHKNNIKNVKGNYPKLN
jgi:hypothetical protein